MSSVIWINFYSIELVSLKIGIVDHLILSIYDIHKIDVKLTIYILLNSLIKKKFTQNNLLTDERIKTKRIENLYIFSRESFFIALNLILSIKQYS